MDELYFSEKLKNILLLVNKNLSFDKNLIRAIQSYERLRKGSSEIGVEINIILKLSLIHI